MDYDALHDLLLKKDMEIAGLDQLRKDHIEKIEKLQEHQTVLEKQIKVLEERIEEMKNA